MSEPWGLSGPQFLALYWTLMGLAVVAMIAGVVVSRRATRPARPTDDQLDAYELAMLAGGPRRVEATAIAGLVASDALRMSRRGVGRPTGAGPQDEIQRFVLGRIGRVAHLRSQTELGLRDSAMGRELIARLVERGYLVTGDRARRLHWIVAGVGVIGVTRLLNGLAEGRPVGWLFLSLLGTVVVWFVARRALRQQAGPFTTSQGKAVLARAEERTRRTEYTSASAMPGVTVLGVVALYGLGAYPDEELSEIFTQPATGSVGGGGSVSSCGGATSGCSSGSSGSSGGGGSSCGGGSGCGG